MRGTLRVGFAVLSMAIMIAALSVNAWAVGGSRAPEQPMEKPSSPAEPMLQQTEQMPPTALEGHCPVCIVQMDKWVKGDPSYQITRDGRTYFFSSEKEKNLFLADPGKFVPALGGDCVVTFAMTGKRVPGNREHMTLHKGRLFLFANDEAEDLFEADPATYENLDLALDGDCPVCLADDNQRVPGRPELVIHHEGIRYFFPSEKQRGIFLDNPDKYKVETTIQEKEIPEHEHGEHHEGSESR